VHDAINCNARCMRVTRMLGSDAWLRGIGYHESVAGDSIATGSIAMVRRDLYAFSIAVAACGF
jgi:hypothetical protein